MSLITKYNRITLKRFAAIPPLLDLSSIGRASPTVSGVSSFRGPDLADDVPVAEGCFVTKCVKYTHQLVHWINDVRSGEDQDDQDLNDIIEDLGVISHSPFHVDQECNLAFLEAFIHTSLEVYAFVAVTASSSTLDKLITMVSSDNDRRQCAIDKSGFAPRRLIDFHCQSFRDPIYELVALHPEHFLPRGSMLTVSDRTTGTFKHYVAAKDRRLRESYEPNSPRFPPFRHNFELRDDDIRMNVFLVILNAEIKFHRYFKTVKLNPPAIPLPQDVLILMEQTVKLVDLLYWEPVPTKGSAGESIVAGWVKARGEHTDAKGENDYPPPVSSRHRVRRLMASMDLETRKAYGSALMSGHDPVYDPALFENAFPIDSTDTYSNEAQVQEWIQGVSVQDVREHANIVEP